MGKWLIILGLIVLVGIIWAVTNFTGLPFVTAILVIGLFGFIIFIIKVLCDYKNLPK